MSKRPPIVIAFFGTSLTTGRLSADWVPRLKNRLKQEPEALGPIIIYNMGRGSQTSDWGATNAPEISKLRPTHILFEGFGINDCAIGPVSLAQSAANFDSMVSGWRSEIPGVDLTHQTMSPAWTGDSARVNLQDYYDQELAKAAAAGIPSLDHTPDWPPIDASNTNGTSMGPFVLPVTSGYGDLGVAAWNPSDKSASVTLSDGNLTFSANAPGVAGVRADTAITGQKHFEVVIGSASANYPGLGIANASAPFGSFIGSEVNGMALYGDGNVWTNGGIVGASGFLPVSGDRIGIEVDRAANLLYVMKGAIRSTGFSISGISGSIYPAATVSPTGTGGTAKFGSNGSGGDCLHPIWSGVFELYSYPSILAWAKAKMAEHWA